VCNNGNTTVTGFFGFFELQKKNPFWGFFTHVLFFCPFFSLFGKNAKKVIFLENALIFEKKV
jgi:hypothetical protein